MVINIPQQERLMALIKGEIGLGELGNEIIVEGVPQSQVNEINDESEEAKMAQLQKLIEELGL